jgi:hypothetical protein
MLKKEHKLRMNQNSLLRRVFGLKRNKGTRGLHKEDYIILPFNRDY